MKPQRVTLVESNLPALPPGSALPAPTRTKDVLTPSDFAGMWPARFTPDYWINLHQGGVPFFLTPQDHPIVVPAGTITQTILETAVEFDQFVVTSMSSVRPTAGQNAFIDNRLFRLDCERRDLGAQEQLDAGFVAFSNVFGTGRYPHPFAIPLVLSADTHFQIRLRNRELFDLQVWFSFSGIRKRATRQAQLPR